MTADSHEAAPTGRGTAYREAAPAREVRTIAHLVMDLAVRQQSLSAGTSWVWAERAGRSPTSKELSNSGFEGSCWLEGPSGARNLLLLLPGLGDKPASLARLAESMALPETSALALRAPVALPAGLDGYMWYNSFTAEGELLQADSLEITRTRERLCRLLTMLESCGWPSHRTFLMGYMQGGLVALDLALHFHSRLGGVVSVCAHQDDVKVEEAASAIQTPLLIVASTECPKQLSSAQRLCRRIHEQGGHVRLSEIQGSSIRSEREMRPLMEFFAENLELHCAMLQNDPSIVRVQ
ncbi:hypothetical protein AB1Y20_013698 [Prymnesium parvum]|uniref:Phospholipase/carboxylesterase/thioesterase domain-containing protein n=1 Tax=Prymnesium parvum TaxID=97485 RepID=A0AB34IGE3_PRYPA